MGQLWNLVWRKETLFYLAETTKINYTVFWLGQCIANWTGLVIEMDKIGITSQQKLSTPYTQVRYASFTENDFVRNFYVKQLPCTVNRRNLVVETT